MTVRSPRPARRRIRAPRAVVLAAAVGAAFILLPFVGLLRQVRWSTIADDLGAGQARAALLLSLASSVAATTLALLLGAPLAWTLARMDFRGRSLLRALVTLPMVLPPVVGGAALLAVYGRSYGLLGGWLFDAAGVQLTFSWWGVVVAEAFVAMPFLVLALEGGIASVDRRYEQAAATLGASPTTRLLRVTARLLLPSLGAGLALAWARALGEFGATITFAGNIEGRTQTAPLAVYLLLESDPGAAYALSAALVAICVTVLVALRGRWWGSRR